MAAISSISPSQVPLSIPLDRHIKELKIETFLARGSLHHLSEVQERCLSGLEDYLFNCSQKALPSLTACIARTNKISNLLNYDPSERPFTLSFETTSSWDLLLQSYKFIDLNNHLLDSLDKASKQYTHDPTPLNKDTTIAMNTIAGDFFKKELMNLQLLFKASCIEENKATSHTRRLTILEHITTLEKDFLSLSIDFSDVKLAISQSLETSTSVIPSFFPSYPLAIIDTPSSDTLTLSQPISALHEPNLKNLIDSMGLLQFRNELNALLQTPSESRELLYKILLKICDSATLFSLKLEKLIAVCEKKESSSDKIGSLTSSFEVSCNAFLKEKNYSALIKEISQAIGIINSIILIFPDDPSCIFDAKNIYSIALSALNQMNSSIKSSLYHA